MKADLKKRSILNLFNDSQIKNLKGAFLEVLSFRIFETYFKPNLAYTDCNLCIDGWKSQLTVDIAMEFSDFGLVCECKVPSSKFNSDIFYNLLNIRYYSENYFHPYAVTLDCKGRMDSKKHRIEHAIGY